jgi:hypothetical protein
MGKRGPAPAAKPQKDLAVKPTNGASKQLTPEEQKRRNAAMSEYDKKLADVRDLEAMTDTDSWRRIHTEIHAAITEHGVLILDAEGRDVIRHQEGVKILRNVIDKVKKPIDELNKFITGSGPLFTSEMRHRAEWNSALGKVEMREV